jgi:hypothetical protein
VQSECAVRTSFDHVRGPVQALGPYFLGSYQQQHGCPSRQKVAQTHQKSNWHCTCSVSVFKMSSRAF